MDTTLTVKFWLPTKPISLIGAINRRAASTGSIGYAMAASGADYNGHRVAMIPPNQFKSYWTGTYFWAGNRTVARGSFEDAHRQAKEAYEAMGEGASVFTQAETMEQVRILAALGYEVWTQAKEDAHIASYTTWKHRAFSDDVLSYRFQLNGNRQPDPELLAKLIQWDENDERGWVSLMIERNGFRIGDIVTTPGLKGVTKVVAMKYENGVRSTMTESSDEWFANEQLTIVRRGES